MFVATPQVVVDAMLKLAEVGPKDSVYDLGCGDGIMVVSAAKMGAQATGFDVNPVRVRETQENIRKNDVGRLANVVEKDIFKQDLSGASVVMLYLLPEINQRLIPQLQKLKAGSRIVSHDSHIQGVRAEKTIEVQGPTRVHIVHLWHTPLVMERQ